MRPVRRRAQFALACRFHGVQRRLADVLVREPTALAVLQHDRAPRTRVVTIGREVVEVAGRLHPEAPKNLAPAWQVTPTTAPGSTRTSAPPPTLSTASPASITDSARVAEIGRPLGKGPR